jgi:hypothetical protein
MGRSSAVEALADEQVAPRGDRFVDEHVGGLLGRELGGEVLHIRDGLAEFGFAGGALGGLFGSGALQVAEDALELVELR